MPREKIDRAALTVFRVRNLGNNLPAELGQDRGEPLAELRMAAIHHSIDVATPPANDQDELGVEDCQELPKAANRDLVELPAFRTRDQVLTRRRTSSHFPLGDGQPMA